MDAALLLVFVGALLSIAVLFIIGLAWLYTYLTFYASRVSYLSYFTTNPLITQYFALLVLAFLDTITYLVQSTQQFLEKVTSRVIVRLPLIVGVLVLSLGAIAWTEYHDVVIEKSYSAYQAIPVTLIYDLKIGVLLNLGSLAYSVGTPFLTFGVRLYRFFLRTIPRLLVTRSLPTIQTSVLNLTNGIIQLVNSFTATLDSPIGVANAPLNTQSAYKTILSSVADLIIGIVNDQCSPIAFLAEIIFRVVGSDGTARFFAAGTNLTFNFAVRLPVRTILAKNPGTVPGVTASYDFIPNPDFFFDDLKELWLAIGDVINAEIVIVVIEFVGRVEDEETGSVGTAGLFLPGSSERMILVSPWMDAIFLSISAFVIEVPRAVIHVVWAGVLYALDLTINLINGSLGTNFLPPVSMRCDMREWRALLEFGGTTGLFFKNTDKRIAGTLHTSLDSLEIVLDTIEPTTVLSRLVIPVLRSIVVLVVGSQNILMRYFFHAIDSEFRQFSPSTPPRTGLPIIDWTAPTPLASLPTTGPGPGEVDTLDCQTITLAPGNLIAFAEHLVDDPEGTLIVVDTYGQTFAQAFQELVDLAFPGADLGGLFEEVILFLLYSGDVVAQQLAYFIVYTTGTPAQYDQYTNVRRIERWYLTGEDIGEELRDSLYALHTALTSNTCSAPEDGFFCALGRIVEALTTIGRVLIDQTLFVVDSTRILDPELPSFLEAVNEFEASLESLLTLFLFIVPDLDYTSGNSLRDLFAPFPEPLASIVTLIFRIPNFALVKFRDDVYPDIKSGNLAVVPGLLATWATEVLEFIIGQLIQNVKDIVTALGDLLDLLFDTNLYGDLANAANRLLDLLELFLEDIFLELFALALNLTVATINLFFGWEQDTFSDRLRDFVDALEDLIEFLLTEEPLFVVDLFFALIESLLPSPLNVIVASVARALRTGLCTVLQGFFNTVVSVLNFFGADLDKVNLSCGNKKRAEDEENDTEDMSIEFCKLSKKAYIGREKLHRKTDNIEKALKKIGRNAHASTEKYNMFGGIFTNNKRATLDTDNSTEHDDDPFAHSNSTKFEEHEKRDEGINLSMEEAMQVIAEITEWNGTTLCDKLVKEVARRSTGGRDPSLTLMEQLTYEDCLSRRAIGEIIAVMPNMQWFPEDGLYNYFSWFTLIHDAFRAYSIYSHFKQDKNMPREVVLSDAYKEEWSAKGMNVDHLTEENYINVLNHMTLRDYFRRNNGNYELVASLGNLWGTLRDNAAELGRFLDHVAINNTADPDSQSLSEDATPLEAWYYKYDVGTASANLTDRQKRTRRFWRALMVIGGETLSFGNEIRKRVVATLSSDDTESETYEGINGHIVNKMWQDGRYAVTWLVSGSSTERTTYHYGNGSIAPDPWEQRDRDLERLGFPTASLMWRPANNGTNQRGFGDPPWTRLGRYILSRFEAARKLIFECKTPHACEQRRQAEVLYEQSSNLLTSIRSGWRPGRSTPEAIKKRAYDGNPLGNVEVETGACNLTRVPFCLQCYPVDASVQEIAIATNQFVDYWDGCFQQNVARYEDINTYIASDSINICGGDGTQAIYFPSSLDVTSSSTVFDILGQPDGAINGVIRFIGTEVAAFFENSTLFNADAEPHGIIDGVISYMSTLWPCPSCSQKNAATLDRDSVTPLETLPDYATLYAQSLMQFDPTYAAVTLLPLEGTVLPFIDDLFEKINNVEFSVSLQIDPTLGPLDPIPLPNITSDPTGGDPGTVLGILDLLLFADYNYECTEKKISYLQATGLFIFFGLLFYLGYYAYAELYPAPISFSSILIWLTMMMILPAIFLSVIYIVPVQNFLMLPFPAPPEPFGVDVSEYIFCDILPKCPAIYAGMVSNGPMTEANCRGAPTNLTFSNCKRDFGVRHGVDWVILLGEFLSPGLMQNIRQYGGTFFGPLLSAGALDLDRFAGVDFTDRDVFNSYLSCVFVMSPTVPVGVFFFDLFWSIFVTVVTSYLLGGVVRIIRLATIATLIGLEIAKLLIYNFMFVVSPHATQILENQAINTVYQQGYEGAFVPGSPGVSINNDTTTLDIASQIVTSLTPSVSISSFMSTWKHATLATEEQDEEDGEKKGEREGNVRRYKKKRGNDKKQSPQ